MPNFATTKIAFPIKATQQTILLHKNDKVGLPVESSVPFAVAPTVQTELRQKADNAGSPISATIACLAAPVSQNAVRFLCENFGSPLSASVPVPAIPTRQSQIFVRRDGAGSPVTSVLAFPKRPTCHASVSWQAKRHVYHTATIRYKNEYHNLVTSTIPYRFDWKAIVGTMFRYRHRSKVMAGWRVLARNLETDEVAELGFIDADSETKELTGVELLDGVYEITVLTSSLFWKDARDHNFVTITVGGDESISPLPTITNLRSSVQLGTTNILWSANVTEMADCTFGLWFSRVSPVDVKRPPDTTVWYSPFQTEYSTTFSQHEPCYVAIAAMRETEMGKVHEMFLDWSNTPPRKPDDVIVMTNDK